MKLTILGTGNATVSECYNTCYAISDEGEHFLVDAGGGNRILKVLKDTGIDMNDIKLIHTIALFSVISFFMICLFVIYFPVIYFPVRSYIEQRISGGKQYE